MRPVWACAAGAKASSAASATTKTSAAGATAGVERNVLNIDISGTPSVASGGRGAAAPCLAPRRRAAAAGRGGAAASHSFSAGARESCPNTRERYARFPCICTQTVHLHTSSGCGRTVAPRQPIHRGTPGRRPVPVALVAEKRGKREFTEKRKTYCLFRPVHGPRGVTHRRTEGGTSAWSSGVAGDGRAGWRGEPEPHGWRAQFSW